MHQRSTAMPLSFEQEIRLLLDAISVSLNLKWKGGGLTQCAIRRTFFLILVHHIKNPGDFSPGLSSRKHPHTRGKDFLKDSLVSQSFRMLSMSTS